MVQFQQFVQPKTQCQQMVQPTIKYQQKKYHSTSQYQQLQPPIQKQKLQLTARQISNMSNQFKIKA